MRYNVYYTLAGRRGKTKGSLYPEKLRPDGAQHLQFEAADDEDAYQHCQRTIRPEDTRPLRGHTYMPDCRPLMPVGNQKTPCCIDLSGTAEPLRKAIHNVLMPFAIEGHLLREGDKYRPAKPFSIPSPRSIAMKRKKEHPPTEAGLAPGEAEESVRRGVEVIVAKPKYGPPAIWTPRIY